MGIWFGMVTDISRQKEFEASLDESRKAAERTNQIKSDFLSMISHELRTPLNAISGSTYTLLNDHPQVHQKPELDTINFAVDNLIIMINDLLDFQKIEAGKLTIEKSPLQLRSFVGQLLKGLSFHARDSNNKLEASLSDGLDITVLGDKTRLSQILNNLITNALKFTKEGEVKVAVNLLEKSNGRVRVHFEVSDNGIGIAPEHQEKIFRDFDQIRPTFSSKYGGTGLGLSITRKLLSLMGGNIELESTLNIGSRFFFDLEFEVVENQESNSGNDAGYSDTVLPLNLLMAEDNDVNALVLGKIISKWGFTFERAKNGVEAIAAAKQSSFDCILMDIQMPEMNGFDATLAIKQVSDVPVIALTAGAMVEVAERIEDCGFDGFVSKPIDANELRKMILEVILERNQSA
ncbi:ATP-binding protein [Algoriphagus sp.]|uniref:ATP-binding protein n=1 Tax=Algoriphagus sp. TaxID=1872435 RepID=UPI003F717B28